MKDLDTCVKAFEPRYSYQGLLKLAQNMMESEVDDIKSPTNFKEVINLYQSDIAVKYKDSWVALINSKIGESSHMEALCDLGACRSVLYITIVVLKIIHPV